MNVFVTGGTGFIGRSLIHRLLNMGVNVTALVRTQDHGLPECVRIVVGDILDPDSLNNSAQGCDILYHLAGMISFDPEMREKLHLVNCTGTDHILSLAKDCQVKKTVCVSSACTSGISFSKDNILDERSEPDSRILRSNPYMESKVAAEKIVLGKTGRQDVVIVNPTTVYGEGDRTLNSGTLIKKIYESKILPVPPGGCNVIDVWDVVDGIIKASQHGRSGHKYLLSGYNMSFSSLFRLISSILEKKPFLVPLHSWLRPVFSNAIAAMGKTTGNRFYTRQIADDLFSYKYYHSAKAQQELSWSPQKKFEDTIKEAWNFYKLHSLM